MLDDLMTRGSPILLFYFFFIDLLIGSWPFVFFIFHIPHSSSDTFSYVLFIIFHVHSYDRPHNMCI